MSRDFRKLGIWQKAHTLVLGIYRVTRTFPEDERFGLTSQMRRSAASIPTNIAEGCGRGGEVELARFVVIAQGSNSELTYQLILARDLEILDPSDGEALLGATDELNRMMTTFVARLKAHRS